MISPLKLVFCYPDHLCRSTLVFFFAFSRTCGFFSLFFLLTAMSLQRIITPFTVLSFYSCRGFTAISCSCVLGSLCFWFLLVLCSCFTRSWFFSYILYTSVQHPPHGDSRLVFLQSRLRTKVSGFLTINSKTVKNKTQIDNISSFWSAKTPLQHSSVS